MADVIYLPPDHRASNFAQMLMDASQGFNESQATQDASGLPTDQGIALLNQRLGAAKAKPLVDALLQVQQGKQADQRIALESQRTAAEVNSANIITQINQRKLEREPEIFKQEQLLAQSRLALERAHAAGAYASIANIQSEMADRKARLAELVKQRDFDNQLALANYGLAQMKAGRDTQKLDADIAHTQAETAELGVKTQKAQTLQDILGAAITKFKQENGQDSSGAPSTIGPPVTPNNFQMSPGMGESNLAPQPIGSTFGVIAPSTLAAGPGGGARIVSDSPPASMTSSGDSDITTPAGKLAFIDQVAKGDDPFKNLPPLKLTKEQGEQYLGYLSKGDLANAAKSKIDAQKPERVMTVPITPSMPKITVEAGYYPDRPQKDQLRPIAGTIKDNRADPSPILQEVANGTGIWYNANQILRELSDVPLPETDKGDILGNAAFRLANKKLQERGLIPFGSEDVRQVREQFQTQADHALLGTTSILRGTRASQDIIHQTQNLNPKPTDAQEIRNAKLDATELMVKIFVKNHVETALGYMHVPPGLLAIYKKFDLSHQSLDDMRDTYMGKVRLAGVPSAARIDPVKASEEAVRESLKDQGIPTSSSSAAGGGAKPQIIPPVGTNASRDSMTPGEGGTFKFGEQSYTQKQLDEAAKKHGITTQQLIDGLKGSKP